MFDNALFEVLPKLGELNETAAIKGILKGVLESYGLKTLAYLGTGVGTGAQRNPTLPSPTRSTGWRATEPSATSKLTRLCSLACAACYPLTGPT
jgi:hypothetical protein